MTAHFTTTALANSRVLVEGTDVRGTSGQQVVRSDQWDAINHRTAHDKAVRDFDQEVEKFFAPLTEAMDQLAQVHKTSTDPLLYIVESEGSPGIEASEERLVHLDRDTVILRAIETGHSDRLIWVNEMLELTAAPSVDSAPTADEGPEDPEPEPFGE